MKRFIITLALAVASLTIAKADDRPVTFEKLPRAAREFITTNFPNDKVSYATVDDDIIAPDYQVVLVSGVSMDFHNNGKLEKIKSRNGNIPEGIIPAQIVKAVRESHPDAKIVEYEIDKYTYEVKLSNRLEMKFSSNFDLIGYDD